jgi:hypothetical protein
MYKILDLARGECLGFLGQGNKIAMFETRKEAKLAIKTRARQIKLNGGMFSFLSATTTNSWERRAAHLLEVVEA